MTFDAKPVLRQLISFRMCLVPDTASLIPKYEYSTAAEIAHAILHLQ
jgi:hypothetical protein